VHKIHNYGGVTRKRKGQKQMMKIIKTWLSIS